MSVAIITSAEKLWSSFSGGAPSGRFECPIAILDRGQEVKVTHIYKGFGKIRLENINGKPIPGKKGFQGEDVTPNAKTFPIFD